MELVDSLAADLFDLVSALRDQLFTVRHHGHTPEVSIDSMFRQKLEERRFPGAGRHDHERLAQLRCPDSRSAERWYRRR